MKKKKKSLAIERPQAQVNHFKKASKTKHSRNCFRNQALRVLSFPIGTRSLSVAQKSWKIAAFINVPGHKLRARFDDPKEYYNRVEEIWGVLYRELQRWD